MDYESGFYPNGDPSNREIYGMLYHPTLMGEICPPGWHVPSIEEYGILEDTIGSMNDAWMDPNGWAAVFAGYYNGSSYKFFGNEAFYHTSSVRSSDHYEWVWRLSNFPPYNNVMPVYQEALFGTFFSIRCLMD